MILTAKVLKYIKISRVMASSKYESNSAYQKKGEIRTISILPALSKLDELCILNLLRQEIETKKTVVRTIKMI